ncbi:DinB family protein [Undibacterium sp. Di24W]|uniref:DinB family protein n=1 Tax=Undibacterium sp. Di24W TaxID=3413033 RepID=UPI003BF31448
MSLNQHLQLMAQYNQWMNQKLYDTAASLSADALRENRGAFFGSIFSTLNHLAVADTIWIRRLSASFPAEWGLEEAKQLQQIQALDLSLFEDFVELHNYRIKLDNMLLQLSLKAQDEDLLAPIPYIDIKGNSHKKQLFGLLMHVFNHQTHHRGQITTMFSQANVDVGVTDLNALIPEI